MGRYVGARYAPLFDGQHDNTKAYEPLTVVYDQGNSYCSKKYVPVGVAITNSEYWVLVGNFNQQMADLQASYNNLAGRADQLESRASALELTAEDAANDIAALEDTTEQLGTNKLAKTALKDMFIMEPKVVEIDSLPANMTQSGSVNIEKSGYTPLALRGWTLSVFRIDAVSIGTAAASYTITNTRDTATGGTFSIVILYVKNS